MLKQAITRILIPIDFSDSARCAFYTGLSMAQQNDAEAYILHVSEPLRAFDFGKKRYVDTRNTLERVEKGVKRRIDELWKESGIEAVDRRKIHMIIRGGTAEEEIVAVAKEKAMDLIVLGTSGASGLQALLGSTAERVVRNAPCSVFCVRMPNKE